MSKRFVSAGLKRYVWKAATDHGQVGVRYACPWQSTYPGNWTVVSQLASGPSMWTHAGYLGTAQNLTDQGFCVPLYAEGYGGAQVLGNTIDAGMVGVITGTVDFGVVKTDTAVTKITAAKGPITSYLSVDLPMSSPDKYEIDIKLDDGQEQTFKRSGSIGAVSVNWAQGRVELQSKPKQM